VPLTISMCFYFNLVLFEIIKITSYKKKIITSLYWFKTIFETKFVIILKQFKALGFIYMISNLQYKIYLKKYLLVSHVKVIIYIYIYNMIYLFYFEKGM